MNELQNEIPPYTRADFTETTEPFEFLMQFKDDRFRQEQMLTKMKDYAAGVGIRNFATLFKQYVKTLNENRGLTADNYTEFEGQEKQLNCGQWVCDDFGVSTLDRYGFEISACSHPILPVQRLVDIDTNTEKLKIAYKKGFVWREIIVDKEILASANKIVQLANFGVAVNSENAKYLVKYLTDIEALNYDKIEELNAVGRLGWIEGHGFSPYVDSLVFDGDLSFKSMFEAVSSRGSLEEWLSLCREMRKTESLAKIVLAASFASVLVEPTMSLPFFVHLWGGSENGKSVAMMLGISVWANPEMGQFCKTFNSTNVAQELMAGFCNSLPLGIDELQIVKDVHDFDKLIYSLAEGVGKSRGKKTGGLQKLPTWRNCIITTGEFPIVNERTGAGAVNRVIEINCAYEKLFSNARETVQRMCKNYGHAGRAWIEWLSDTDNMERVRQKVKEYIEEFESKDTTEKQALSASLILTADYFATELLFKDGRNLGVDDLINHLATKKDVSQNERCLQFIYDTVAMNSNRFHTNSYGEYQGEIWGKEDDEHIYIIKTKFDRLLQDEGYNSTAFLTWAKDNFAIEIGADGKSSVPSRINGKVARCVCVKRKIPQNHAENETFDDEFFL